jgi:carbon starvation protein
MIKAGYVVKGWLNIGLTVMLLVCVAVILGSAVLRWLSPATTKVVGQKSG